MVQMRPTQAREPEWARRREKRAKEREEDAKKKRGMKGTDFLIFFSLTKSLSFQTPPPPPPPLFAGLIMFILGTLKLGTLPPVPAAALLLLIKAPNDGIAEGPAAAGSAPKAGRSLEGAPPAAAREAAAPAPVPSSVPSSSTWARASTTPVCAGASLLLVTGAGAAAAGAGGGAGAVSSEGALAAAKEADAHASAGQRRLPRPAGRAPLRRGLPAAGNRGGSTSSKPSLSFPCRNGIPRFCLPPACMPVRRGTLLGGAAQPVVDYVGGNGCRQGHFTT